MVRACILTGTGVAIVLIAINIAARVGVCEPSLSPEEPLEFKVAVGGDM